MKELTKKEIESAPVGTVLIQIFINEFSNKNQIDGGTITSRFFWIKTPTQWDLYTIKKGLTTPTNRDLLSHWDRRRYFYLSDFPEKFIAFLTERYPELAVPVSKRVLKMTFLTR